MGSRNDKKRRRPRRPRRPPPPPPRLEVPSFYARGAKWAPDGTRYRGGREWLDFRSRLGLSSTPYVAALLGVTVRSIQRWEYRGPAPRWYQAALVGLRDIWGAEPPPAPLR